MNQWQLNNYYPEPLPLKKQMQDRIAYLQSLLAKVDEYKAELKALEAALALMP